MYHSLATYTGFRLLCVIILAAVVEAADDAEFAFNLLSDVAPILALFGDQFAKQFTSESLTWVDHLIFAMVPLGIITAITGAIRVQGMQVAKAFIGRARENRALAEIELMSSTSGEVCELFNGNAVVRAMGKPKIAQFLIFPKEYDNLEKAHESSDLAPGNTPPVLNRSCGIHTLETAVSGAGGQCRLMECEVYESDSSAFIHNKFKDILPKLGQVLLWYHHTSLMQLVRRMGQKLKDEERSPSILSLESTSSEDAAVPIPRGAKRALDGPPNLQLNLSSDHFDQRRFKKRHEIILAAITAVLLQSGLIAIAAVAAFHVSPGSSNLLQSRVYGFPCYVAGSVLLSFGTGLCSFIVEHSTIEYSWRAYSNGRPVTKADAPRLVWLQQKQTVNDQAFHGYIISAGPKRRVITSSRNDDIRNRRSSNVAGDVFWEWLAVGAALLAGLGFTAQFMGLRGLAFPCSITQLGAIFIMALIRAGIRRRLGQTPEYCPAFSAYEIDFLATHIVFFPGIRTFHKLDQGNEVHRGEPRPEELFQWRVSTPDPKQKIPFFLPNLDEVSSDGTPSVSRSSSNTQPTNDIPDPDKSKATPAFKPATSQQLLRVRERLGDLSKWTSRSSASALSLAQSIELVMDTFFPGPSSNRKSLKWLLEATQGTDDSCEGRDIVQISVVLQEEDGRWKADLGRIDAVLSLWMASVDSRGPGAPNDAKGHILDEWGPRKRKSATGSGDSFNEPTPDWRRIEAGDNLTYSFYRIIGNNGEDEILKRDISWWVDSLVAEQSEAEGNTTTNDACQKRNDANLIIGFNGMKDKGEARELGISSRLPLPIILAQHLFTSFMWTVAKYLPKDCLTPKASDIQQEVEIEGPQVFSPYNFGQTWLRLRLRHRSLTRLVRQVEAYGLGTTNDILLCMIPALSSMRLLPDQVIANLVPRVGPGHGFAETAAFYNKVLETVKTHEMSIEDKLSIAIVTATMDFLYFAYEPYDEQIEPPPNLKEELETIVLKLKSSKFDTIMERLAPIYERQHRIDVFRKVFQQVQHLQTVSQSFEAFTAPMKLDEDFAKEKLGFSQHHLLVWPTISDKEDMRRIAREFNGTLAGNATIPADVFGWTPYHYSCSFEAPHLLHHLLVYSGNNLDRVNGLLDALQRSPIHIAALGGMESNLTYMFSGISRESLKSIIQAGGIDGMTPLHLLSKSGKVNSLQSMIPKGEAVQLLARKDFWGRQPLHIASSLGHDILATKLLDMGSRSDQPDDLGQTPVDYFLERRKVKLGQNAAQRQASKTSEADEQSPAGDNPDDLHMDEKDSEIFLKFAMESPECRYSHGKTFLHSAVEFAHENSIATLLGRGFDIEARDDDRRTPLHYAILAGRARMAISLIEGVDVNHQTFAADPSAKDSSNTTTLMFAARRNLKAVARALLNAFDSGAINEANDDGETALHHARDLGMVKFLIAQKGCDPLVKDLVGRTTLHTAIELKKQSIAQYLLGLTGPGRVQENPFDNNHESLLVTACRVGFAAVIPEILAKWPHIVNTGDAKYGQTPLSWACENRHLEVVSLLLTQNGIDVNRPATMWNQYTPLHFAVENGDLRIVKLLLQSPSAKLHQQNEFGVIPLQPAVERDWPDIARTLLLDDRTHADAKVRYAKDLIFKSSAEIRRIFWNMLQSIEDESLVREFLGWLYGRSTPTLESSDDGTNARVSALVAPLARHRKNEIWAQLQDPFALITLLGEKEVRDTLEEQQVDESGQDGDHWSLVDYLKRFDRKDTLKSFTNRLHDLDLSRQYSHREPTTLLWNAFQEIVQVTPCNTACDAPNNGWNVQDITVVNESSIFRRACIRSAHSIPPSSSHFYFEVHILKDADYQILGIGFCGMQYGLDRMPGWFKGSWGYHGDDGELFVESSYGRIPSPHFGDPGKFRKGDTVGVCLSMETGQGFCTLNGKRLKMGNAFTKPDERFQFGKMYPCVGFSVGEGSVGLQCRVNFGGSPSYPFKYEGLFDFD